jgi:hypothetical protein
MKDSEIQKNDPTAKEALEKLSGLPIETPAKTSTPDEKILDLSAWAHDGVDEE